MNEYILNSLTDAEQVLKNLLSNKSAIDSIATAAAIMANCLSIGKRIFSCGNGGSMCDAMHFAEELSGRYRNDRKPLAAIAISDPSHISCTANDYGYEHIFSRYIEAHGKKGDVLLAITTSGSSRNIIAAAKKAQGMGITVISLTGVVASELSNYSHINIATPAFSYADRVQELHIKVIHILIEIIERHLFPLLNKITER